MIKNVFTLFAVISLLCTMPVVQGSDYERENNLSQQVAIVDGEAVYLNADGHDFFSVYIEPDSESKGAVIVLHSRGLHPDWPAVARPVRTGLPKHGWATFAIQLPVLPRGSLFEDYFWILSEAGPRIDAAVRFLRQQGYKRVHLVAHSCGAQMAMAWVDTGGGQTIDSLTLISLGMSNFERNFGYPPPLGALTVPILDIYGAEDFVSKRAVDRFDLIKQGGNPYSKQIAVPGAKHMFKKEGDQLVRIINQWLSDLPAS